MASFTDEELAVYEKVRAAKEYERKHGASMAHADRKPILAIRFKDFTQFRDFAERSLDLTELGVYYADGLDTFNVTHVVAGSDGGGRHRAV